MPKTNSINEEGVFEPFSSQHVPWEEYSQGSKFGLRFRQLGEFGGGTQIGVSIEEIEPGKQSYPAHYHMLEEEHILILEGALTVRLDESYYDIAAGD